MITKNILIGVGLILSALTSNAAENKFLQCTMNFNQGATTHGSLYKIKATELTDSTFGSVSLEVWETAGGYLRNIATYGTLKKD
jgi:hypothetical protein